MRIITIAIALLLLPFAASAQMKCPDGSYRTACPGGDGQAFQGGGVSSYSAPEVKQRARVTRDSQTSASSRQSTTSGPKPPPDGAMSTPQRARDMGISRNDLVKAVSRGEVLMGMHRKDVERILGSPTDVDAQKLGGQQCHHLHWWKDHPVYEWVHYIRLCNGRVDHIRQGNT